MCKCKTKRPTFFKVDQSQNGVKVIVTKFIDKAGQITGSTVEADCQCFGNFGRVHNRQDCPVRLKAMSSDAKGTP